MTIQLYITAMTIALTLLFFMGGYLIIGKIPSVLKNSVYSESRIILGIIYILLAIEITFVTIFRLRVLNMALATAIGISTYFLLSILFSLSFTRLVGNRPYFTKQRIKLSLLGWFIYSAALIPSLLFINNEPLKRAILIIAAIIYLVVVILQVILFFKSYHIAIEKANNYYADSVEQVLDWMPKSIYNIIALGLLGGLMSFGNAIVITIFTSYASGVLIYMFARMIQMMVEIPYVSKSDNSDNIIEVISGEALVEESDEDDEPQSEEEEEELSTIATSKVFIAIENKLTTWIEKRQYLESGVSIQSVATAIYTNRTYLSKYINTKYNCSFREWIISLRIQEAKRLMVENNRLQISEISSKVGFSASSSFTRAFTRNEGIAPAKWREINSRQ